MNNLHDKRFERNVAKPAEAWEYVAIPNKFRSGKIKASVDTTGFHVSLVSVHPRATQAGRPPQHDVLHFRGDNPQDLKGRVLKSFPDAVFTTGNPEIDLKAQHASEMRQQKERQAAIADDRQYVSGVTRAHRNIAASLSREEQMRAAYNNFNLFATDENFGDGTPWSKSWVQWFRQQVGFLSWPDASYKNRDILLKYCESKGWFVPLAGEIAQAMDYLLAHGHFYMKSSYKRSERDEINAVLPFEGEQTAIESFSPQQIAEATKKLRSALPVGSVPSAELIQLRAKQLGISNDLLEVILHGGKQIRANVKGQSTAELKSGLQTERNAIRGGARDRRENMKGY